MYVFLLLLVTSSVILKDTDGILDAQIDPAKRHIDKSTVADFWRGLEAWIAMNKPYLA